MSCKADAAPKRDSVTGCGGLFQPETVILTVSGKQSTALHRGTQRAQNMW